MVKVTKANAQLRINIPKEIAALKGWDENTDLHFVPFLENPNSELDESTPIIIRAASKKQKPKTK